MFDKRSALVTGSTKGIGHAIARALAEEGFGVTINGRSEDSVAAAAAKLVADGIEVHGVVADVCDPTDIARLVAAHRDRFGGLDVLVNNAGLMIPGPVTLLDPEHFDLQVAANLRSTLLMCKHAAPMLVRAGTESGSAHIVNIASIAGHYGQGFMPAYSATKAGVLALSQALHDELAGDGVRVTALSPSFVATDQTSMLPIPREELIQPSDIGEAVRFLVRTSSACVVPTIQFLRRSEKLFAPV
jgi:NAD(P)-dependent dehydrogenase (short-subunit alcohol dehydrogenase family)